MKINVGDLVRYTGTNQNYFIPVGTLGRVLDVNYEGEPDAYVQWEDGLGNKKWYAEISDIELIEAKTNVEEIEAQEVQDIVDILNDYTFAKDAEGDKTRVVGKRSLALAAIIKVLVAKGVVSPADFKRVLATPAVSNVPADEGK